MTILRQERGWAGHFICASRCNFRRNTLLTNGITKIVVSTVGNMETYEELAIRPPEPIGYDRYYETMCFYAKENDPYNDADVSRQVGFSSKWGISKAELGDFVDNLADAMHEKVVQEMIMRLRAEN